MNASIYFSTEDARLIKRLWEQDIPLTMIIWVKSFLNDRTDAVRLDGKIGDQEPIKIGVPQESPIASIFFMLFTAQLFKIPTKEEKKAGIKIRKYIDDELSTTRASNEVPSAAKIQETFIKIEAWAIQNGIVFDQAKFEVIYFSRKKHFPNQENVLLSATTATVEKRPRILKPIQKKRSMHWLGVYFDLRLLFSNHAAKMASKSQKAATGPFMLVKKTRGVEAVIMRKEMHPCILPILTLGTSAWWPGRTRTNREGRTIRKLAPKVLNSVVF